MLIDWQSDGEWRYTKRSDLTDLSSPDLDDSGWPWATLPFGTLGASWSEGWPSPRSGMSLTDVVWLRRRLPDGSYTLRVRHDDEGVVFFNGQQVYYSNVYPGSGNTDIPITGEGVLAVRGRDTKGSIAYLDVRLDGGPSAVRQWPRDDALGLGAGPRLHPPSQGSLRLYGGIQ